MVYVVVDLGIVEVEQEPRVLAKVLRQGNDAQGATRDVWLVGHCEICQRKLREMTEGFAVRVLEP